MAKMGGREADKKGAGDDVHKGNGSKSGQDEDKGMNQKKTGGSTATSPPAMEKDTHTESGLTEKFFGDSAGNADRNTNLTGPDGGGGGESHPFSHSGPFVGATKGNKDRPVDISRGTGGKEGGKYVAGRGNKVFSGNKGGF
jgi:hypothetical protein